MIGDKIRLVREEKKLKQLDVAIQLGIEQSTYAKIENGQIKITVERIIKIAKIFNVPITDLLNDPSKIKKSKELNIEHLIDLIEKQNVLHEKQNELYEKLLTIINTENKSI